MFIAAPRKIYYLHVRNKCCSFIFIVGIIPSLTRDDKCVARSSGCVFTHVCVVWWSRWQLSGRGMGGALQTDLGWLILYVAIWSKSPRKPKGCSWYYITVYFSKQPRRCQAAPATRQSLCRAAARSASSVSLLLRCPSAGLSSNFKRAELQMTIWMSSDSLQTPRRPFILHVLF